MEGGRKDHKQGHHKNLLLIIAPQIRSGPLVPQGQAPQGQACVWTLLFNEQEANLTNVLFKHSRCKERTHEEGSFIGSDQRLRTGETGAEMRRNMLITVPFRHLCVRSFGVGGKCDCSGLRGNRGAQSSTPPVSCASRTGAHMLLLSSLIIHSRQLKITPLTWPTGAVCARACVCMCVHSCLGAYIFPEWHQSHVLLIKDIMHCAEKAWWQWSEFRLYNPPDLIIPTLQSSNRYAAKLSQRHSEAANFSFCFLVGSFYRSFYCKAFCLSFILRFSFCGWRSRLSGICQAVCNILQFQNVNIFLKIELFDFIV